MSDAEADAVMALLRDAGVEVDWFAYFLADGRPVPPEADFLALDPFAWDAAFTPVWVVLPATDPRAAAVDEARTRFFDDAAYAKALEHAHCRYCAEIEAARAEREDLWEVA
ncbi:MAG TPA: hypothetical protein VD866_02725 [Urbifossiella sp.]|nr:hypothetical protein [Urbifossiella sp.]